MNSVNILFILMQSYYTSLEDNFENEDEVLLEPSDYGANEAESK